MTRSKTTTATVLPAGFGNQPAEATVVGYAELVWLVVRFDDGTEAVAVVSPRLRDNYILVLPTDRVAVEPREGDPSWRITHRLAVGDRGRSSPTAGSPTTANVTTAPTPTKRSPRR